jgi:putative RNA 2'-phosphotransferase
MSIQNDSRYLSYLLRHHPETIGLTMTSSGWVNVEELTLNSKGLFTLEYLEEIVATDKKKRYSFNENKTMIRANQGHSIPINPDLEEKEPPYHLYHGTASRFLESIKATGIQKQSRTLVHLSQDKDTAYTVGKRHGEPVIIVINAFQMHKDGIKFYQSENGVWLTDYVDPKYFSVIYNNKIILYSAWKFVPDEKFIKKMNELGYTNYDDENLRLDPRMVKFIEDNMEEYYTRKAYLAEKADTKGRAGITHTTAWIDYVDTTQNWAIINGSHPFIGAEEIKYFNIKHRTNNRIDIVSHI